MSDDPVVADRYPQVTSMTPEGLRKFLAHPHLARMATHEADGSIHLVPIWYLAEFDGDELTALVVSTQAANRKVANVQRDARVTLTIDTAEMPYAGVMVVGTAEVDPTDAAARRIPIFERYIGDLASAYAEGLAAKWDPVLIRVTPERVVSFDYRRGSLL